MSIVPDYKYFLSLGLGRPLPPPFWNSSIFMHFFFFEGFPNEENEFYEINLGQQVIDRTWSKICS